MLLCTLDITNLYTNIPHNEGVQAIKEFVAIHRDINAPPQNSYIIELLQVVLTNNYFDLMANTTIRNLGQPWAPNWHLHMPTCL